MELNYLRYNVMILYIVFEVMLYELFDDLFLNNKILRIKLFKIFGIIFLCMLIYFFSIVNFVICVSGCVI